jgi:3D (Asp-Asp-Asp) domain-containing protein
MYRLVYLLMILMVYLYAGNIAVSGEVLGVSTSAAPEDIYAVPGTANFTPEYTTTTAFAQKEITERMVSPYDTTYEDDPETEYGEESVMAEGINGEKVYRYLLTYWEDEEIDRKLISVETEEPVTRIISKGTKVVWRLLEGTEHGRLRYWYKMRVWATKYDANCLGCTGRTYSGTEVKKGVCATDPKVIPLGTNFYVAGYGLCRAEDIGGAIKGNKIDLGYVDAALGEWRTGYTDIYLLTNAPQ